MKLKYYFQLISATLLQTSLSDVPICVVFVVVAIVATTVLARFLSPRYCAFLKPLVDASSKILARQNFF